MVFFLVGEKRKLVTSKDSVFFHHFGGPGNCKWNGGFFILKPQDFEFWRSFGQGRFFVDVNCCVERGSIHLGSRYFWRLFQDYSKEHFWENPPGVEKGGADCDWTPLVPLVASGDCPHEHCIRTLSVPAPHAFWRPKKFPGTSAQAKPSQHFILRRLRADFFDIFGWERLRVVDRTEQRS